MNHLQIDNTTLAAVLRSCMQERGMSMSALAAKAHISKSTLSKILSGSTSPYVHTLYQICEALDVELADVLLSQENLQKEVKCYNLSEEELGRIVFIRGLSEDKRRWLDVSLELLAAYGEDTFPD